MKRAPYTAQAGDRIEFWNGHYRPRLLEGTVIRRELDDDFEVIDVRTDRGETFWCYPHQVLEILPQQVAA